MNLEYLITILSQIREQGYPVETMQKYCDDYFFEEGDVIFTEEFINIYNFIPTFFLENLHTLNHWSYRYIVDFLIKAFKESYSPEEILVFLYQEPLFELQKKRKNNNISNDEYKRQVVRIIGNNVNEKKVLAIINGK